MINNRNATKQPAQKTGPLATKSLNPTTSTTKTTKPAPVSSTAKTPSTTGSSLGSKLVKNQGKAPEEEKKEAPKAGFTGKPSAKLANIKTADPFAPKANIKNNSFAYVYNAGGIPCRVDHGTYVHRLKWDSNVNLEDLHFDPLLITCFEGLIETTHPYNFIAKTAIKELLESPGAGEKTIPLLPRLISPLRLALGNSSPVVFENALNTLKLLSDTVGDGLNEHLSGLLGSIVKRLNDKNFKEKVQETLHTVEENGGPSVVKIIKAKIPTYTTIS